jgi:hypothetical protein
MHIVFTEAPRQKSLLTTSSPFRMRSFRLFSYASISNLLFLSFQEFAGYDACYVAAFLIYCMEILETAEPYPSDGNS